MKVHVVLLTAVVFCFVMSSSAFAQSDNPQTTMPGVIDSIDSSPQPAPLPAPQAHPAAVTYSRGYEVRRNIHRIASYTTLPLFATELALGQSLFNNSTGTDSGTKTAHIVVGTGLIGLFGLNAVTGVWNMMEDRGTPDGKAWRTTHGILMLAAGAGFAATAATGPGHRRFGTTSFEDQKSTHRAIAVASIGVGTAGYLMMLFHRH